jgi:hypothetical protein
MCQALYKMNKAYLTLPVVAQSGPGLAALMADAYHRAEGGGGEASSDEDLEPVVESGISPERRSSSRKPVPSAKAVASGQAWLAEEQVCHTSSLESACAEPPLPSGSTQLL